MDGQLASIMLSSSIEGKACEDMDPLTNDVEVLTMPLPLVLVWRATSRAMDIHAGGASC